MTDKPFGWCFIGTGTLAKQVAEQLLKSKNHKLVSCYTRNPDNGQAFAKAYGCSFYETAEAAMTAEGVEGVYIVTTHNAHFRFAKQALSLGIPVFCEKAFTVTAAEADELIALAKEKQVYLAEAMWTWFSPAANQVKTWIDQKAIGSIREASFTYHMKSIGYAPRVADPKRAGGALLDITIYPITYAYRLWGYPEKIESTGIVQDGIDHGEDVLFTYPDFKVKISASITDMKGFEVMKIKGDKGKISAILYHCCNTVTKTTGFLKTKIFRGPGPFMNLYTDEFDIVAKEIREDLLESRMVTLQMTSDVMHILDTVREQIGLSYDNLE